jgi:hypothetical protein
MREEAPQSSIASHHRTVVVNDKIHIESESRDSVYRRPEGVSQSNIDDHESRDYDMSKPPNEPGSLA